MKLLLKKEEEREKVKKKEQLEEEILKVEDPHPMEDSEEGLVVQKSRENLMDWTHLNLTLCSY